MMILSCDQREQTGVQRFYSIHVRNFDDDVLVVRHDWACVLFIPLIYFTLLYIVYYLYNMLYNIFVSER